MAGLWTMTFQLLFFYFLEYFPIKRSDTKIRVADFLKSENPNYKQKS